MSKEEECKAISKIVQLTEAEALTWTPKQAKEVSPYASKSEARFYACTFQNFNLLLLVGNATNQAVLMLVNAQNSVLYSFKDCTEETEQLVAVIEGGILAQVDAFLKAVSEAGIPGPKGEA